MRQFVLPDSFNELSPFVVSGTDAKRLFSVLRLKPQDSFLSIDKNGKRYNSIVLEISEDYAKLELIEQKNTADYIPDIRSGKNNYFEKQEASNNVLKMQKMPNIVLGVGMLKGSKLDDVVRIAVEAGISKIVPLITEYSIPLEYSQGRTARLERIVKEATGQSGSSVFTNLLKPMKLASFVEAFPVEKDNRVAVFFHEVELNNTPLHKLFSTNPREIVIAVGPEGGFSDSELLLFSNNMYNASWLGPSVLRAETAAIFAVASIQIVCLERNSWSVIE